MDWIIVELYSAILSKVFHMDIQVPVLWEQM